MRQLLLVLLLLLIPAFAQAQISQRDWAIQLIDSLGWSFGLPEKPTDADFAQILSGSRVYRIEAEDVHQRGDRVSVMNFTSFGEFSGAGWLNGIKDPTEAHLQFILPHSGRYRVTARVRLAEHRLIFGTRNFRVSGGSQFTTVEVGYVELQAGQQEALLQLRPNGSIDYFELEAEPFGPISPAEGWDFDAELTAEVAARTTVQALNLQANLPAGRQVLNLEAENLPKPAGVLVLSDTGRGSVSGGRYVQVGAAPVSLSFYSASIAGGVADLVLRATSTGPITVSLPGYIETRQQFPRRFEDRLLGTFFLPEGEILIEVRLPPGAALDRLEIRSRRGSGADLMRLVGLSATEPLTIRDINNLLALIHRLKVLR